MMKRTILTIVLAIISYCVNAQSFSLPGDGNWHRVATTSGQHAYFQYVYFQNTPNNPSMANGEIEFINYQNFTIQHHQTIGYGGWYQPQFALVNLGTSAEIWVLATNGASAGTFAVINNTNATINQGDLSVSNLSTRGGVATVYNKIRDNSDTFYSNVLIPSGSLSIGTNVIDPSYKFSVEGNVHAQQINVDMNGWADYVFGKDYALPSLTEVKTYIDQNHHLPEIPSAQQIEKDGLNLGEMNKLLVKKVEELPLYLIEKDKEVKLEQEQIDQLKDKLIDIEKKLTHTSN
ncbi:MAG TPA: hypothetical protein VGI43_01375 [Mucilaginibacter sp.]|jgi:hypothetical protein